MSLNLQKLADRFRERSALDLQVLRRHLGAETLDSPEVEAAVHRLAGAAGIFGYKDIGSSAREIDDSFATGRPADRRMVEALIADLSTALATDPPAGPAASPPAPDLIPNPATRAAVLIVEDDGLLGRIAERELRRLGYETVLADSAADLLGKIDQLPPIDLLFTDLMMPGPVDGRALAAEMQRRQPGLRVLFTSGRSQSSADPGQEPSSAFLPKPYQRSALAAAVQAILNRPMPASGDTIPPAGTATLTALQGDT